MLNVLVFACLIAGPLCQSSTQAVLWSSQNCNTLGGASVVRGTVTDAICCNSTADNDKCKAISSNNNHHLQHQQQQCEAEDTCNWIYFGVESRYRCVLNRDRKNNVCCQAADIKQNCVDMMAGRCPKAWQIPSDCCPDPYNKYADVLLTSASRSDLVCCNAPCRAIEQAWNGNQSAGISGKSQCTAMLSENCAPAKRGYMQDMMAMQMGGGAGHMGYGGMGQQGGYGQNMYGGGGGGLPMDMISQLMGMPVSQPMEVGKVMGMMGGNTGLDGGLTLQALEQMGFGSSKDEHVDEITVDDFFDAIIESLDNDKDVFEYNKEINSDSWFGKQVMINDFNFLWLKFSNNNLPLVIWRFGGWIQLHRSHQVPQPDLRLSIWPLQRPSHVWYAVRDHQGQV